MDIKDLRIQELVLYHFDSGDSMKNKKNISLLAISLLAWTWYAQTCSTNAQEYENALKTGDLDIIERYITNNRDNIDSLPITTHPLQIAVEHNQLNIVKALIKAGANINAQDKFGSPLHYAAWFRRPEIAHALLTAGADINRKQLYYDRTPLHAAAQYGYADIVEILIMAGADIDAIDKDGNTPLQLARQEQQQKLEEQQQKLGGYNILSSIFCHCFLMPMRNTGTQDPYTAVIDLLERQNQRNKRIANAQQLTMLE